MEVAGNHGHHALAEKRGGNPSGRNRLRRCPPALAGNDFRQSVFVGPHRDTVGSCPVRDRHPKPDHHQSTSTGQGTLIMVLNLGTEPDPEAGSHDHRYCETNDHSSTPNQIPFACRCVGVVRGHGCLTKPVRLCSQFGESGDGKCHPRCHSLRQRQYSVSWGEWTQSYPVAILF